MALFKGLLAEHVVWCREERNRLIVNLDSYRTGVLSIGDRKTGEAVTQGTITHVRYLERAIGQTELVIAAYSPPPSGEYPLTRCVLLSHVNGELSTRPNLTLQRLGEVPPCPSKSLH